MTGESFCRRSPVCCVLILLILAVVVATAVIIAFLVQKPSVDYDRFDVVCADNNYIKCANEGVQLFVYLQVKNPNIIGAGINAELELLREDGTLVGPGVVEDVHISARSTTNITALFQVTALKGVDILTSLYLPPRKAVQLRVNGKVFVHLGALKPSFDVGQDITIQPPALPSITQIPQSRKKRLSVLAETRRQERKLRETRTMIARFLGATSQ